MDQLIFICTGNYYRSRFAKAVFNHHAAEQHLNWRAFSRGLAIHLAPEDGLSIHTRNALAARGISIQCTAANKAPVSESDLRRATRRIALKEAEHRPYLRAHFPDWEEKVEYWHIHDLDVTQADEALAEIEAKVIALVQQLAERSR